MPEEHPSNDCIDVMHSLQDQGILNPPVMMSGLRRFEFEEFPLEIRAKIYRLLLVDDADDNVKQPFSRTDPSEWKCTPRIPCLEEVSYSPHT